MVNLPNNPIARDSVTRYLSAMKSVFRRVADGLDADAAVRVVRDDGPTRDGLKVPPMKVVLAAHGTRGDVEPCATGRSGAAATRPCRAHGGPT